MTEVRHEVEVDTRIAAAHGVWSKAVTAVAHATESKKRAAGGLPWYAEEAAKRLEVAEAALAEASEARVKVEAEYEGWSRFFLVNNNNGHIHRTTSCSTCYWTTSFSWLPALSGLTEAEAVEEWGGILCSVCFPTAPVEWTTGTNKKTAAEKELAKALRAIERSPEGKKVKSARELVRRKSSSIEHHERRLALWAEYGEDAEAAPTWLPAEAAKAEATLPKLRKELARAEAKLTAAEAALDAALAA